MSIIEHYIKLHSVYKYAGSFIYANDTKEIINLLFRYHIKTDIIGQYFYCFTTALIGVQLQAIGFRYSAKHRAYIFLAYPKESIVEDERFDLIPAGSKTNNASRNQQEFKFI